MSFLKNLMNRENDVDSRTLADRVFTRSVVMSLIAAALCIVIFSTSTLAWFVESVDSEEMIKSSVYILTVVVDPDIASTQDADGNAVYSLQENTTYKITVSSIADERTTAKSGYIKIIANGKVYYSEQIDRGESITFDLIFSFATDVTIVECWGTSSIPFSDRDIVSGNTYLNMQNTNP